MVWLKVNVNTKIYIHMYPHTYKLGSDVARFVQDQTNEPFPSDIRKKKEGRRKKYRGKEKKKKDTKKVIKKKEWGKGSEGNPFQELKYYLL